MPATPAIPGQGRPEPPVELSDSERQIWVACVESRPLNYFDKSTWPLLKAYCMHAVQAANLAAELRRHATDKLRREHRQQTAMLANLATRLRLTKLGTRRDQRSEQGEIAKTPKHRLWVVEPGDES
jgi:hypothetical protein